MLYVLTDTNQNVVGLADSGGRLVASYQYSPYGVVKGARYFSPDSSLISEEARAAARTSRLGHQGLRFERYDRPWRGRVANGATGQPGDGSAAVIGAVFEPEYADVGPGTPSTATLALADGLPGYDGVYHNRNRMYDPENGRFIEVDPRGLGLPVLDDLSYNGASLSESDVDPNIVLHYQEGLGAHLAYAQNPGITADPSGLFGILDIGIGTGTLEGLYQDNAERVGEIGQSIYGGASSLLRRAAITQLVDAEWALDWTTSDDDYFAAGTSGYSLAEPPKQERDGGSAIVFGGLTGTERSVIKNLAEASKHGGTTHMRQMGVSAIEAIEELLDSGKLKSLSEVDFDKLFNKGGKQLGRMRPDVQIRTTTGKLLAVVEVAVSQSETSLFNKIRELSKFLPKRIKPNWINIKP